jgi:uncharacterized protein (TIGR02594 family)
MRPDWLVEAERHLGVTEIPGSKTNATIGGWLKRLGAWWSDDATPWCGVFVAHCMEASGIALPKYWMRAKDWAAWGSKLSAPETGCVVVFERKGGGHVGFVVGRTMAGNLLVLGGNQGDMVKISEFSRDRVIGYYWPPSVPLPMHQALLVMAPAELSINEA